MSFRIGSGFDAHRLVAGRPLRLGGVLIPGALGLEGHSDGDCLFHAVCDALLGAAAAGDMGLHFPSSDERWRGTASETFARETARLVRERGFEIENLDATVIAQAPRLSAHLPAMVAGIATALLVPAERVSVKAKSTDGLGTIGRGEGMAAMAVALLRQSKGNG